MKVTRIDSNGTRKVVATIRRATLAITSADGSKVAVGTGGPGCGDQKAGLAVVEASGRVRILAVPLGPIAAGDGLGAAPLAWSPGGSIAVAVDRKDLGECGRGGFSSSTLLLVDAATGQTRRVGSASTIRSASWSPSGHFLAFAEGYNDECALTTVDVKRLSVLVVATGNAYGGSSPLDCNGEISFAWLPSGKLLYTLRQALWRFDPRTGSRTRVLPAQARSCPTGCAAELIALTHQGRRVIMALNVGEPAERWIAADLATRRVTPIEHPRTPGRGYLWLRLFFSS
jgi:dipeptidyl aminopeptidase/acylaminoacyl peptidase